MMNNQGMYYPSPALQSAQQRLQMMEAQFPQFTNPTMGYPQMNPYPPQQQTQPVQGIPIKGRPVSNEDEANAAMIDFDGSLFVFPDKAHGRIYTKQLGMDGNIIFSRYVLETPTDPSVAPSPVDQPVPYAKQSDLEKALQSIEERFTAIEQHLTSNK